MSIFLGDSSEFQLNFDTQPDRPPIPGGGGGATPAPAPTPTRPGGGGQQQAPPTESIEDILDEYRDAVRRGEADNQANRQFAERLEAAGMVVDDIRSQMTDIFNELTADAGSEAPQEGFGGEAGGSAFPTPQDFAPGSLGEFALDLGIDIEDPANSAILPQLRETFASQSATGRAGLFQGALDDVLPIGGPSILGSAFSGLGNRASTNFLFANALGTAPRKGAGGDDFPLDIDLGGSFSQFLNQPGAFGGFQDDLSQFLQLAQDPNALAFRQGQQGFRPEAFNLRQQLVNNPGSAFDFLGSQFQGPAFSPFAGAASRARDRIFGQFQRDNPNLTGLDFLQQFGQGNFSGLF